MREIPHRRYIVIALVLMAAAVGVRMINADKPFSGDETILMEIARQEGRQVVPEVVAKDVYPPLTYLAAHGILRFTGAESWVRVYFLVFGAGVCWMVYLITRECFGVQAASIALLLSVFSPLLIFASQYARSYIDSAFWMLLSVLCMLKILRGDARRVYWAGYVVAAALSLYTFYFSALLFVAEWLVVTVVCAKEPKRLLAWYAAFSLVALIFAPWAPIALKQFNNASSLAFNWASTGVSIGPFRVGLYARNIAALIGFDPAFMVFRQSVRSLGPTPAIVAAGAVACGTVLCVASACLRIARQPLTREGIAVRLLLVLVFVPLVLTWFLAAAVNTLPVAKYFVAFHALFLVLIGATVADLLGRRRVRGIVVLCVMILMFVARIPSAVSAEFGSHEAALFLRGNAAGSDLLVCGRLCPDEEIPCGTVRTGDDFVLEGSGSAYAWASPGAAAGFRERLLPYKKIWFYRVYGNAEMFGLNRLLEKEFVKAGYVAVRTASFANIDVVHYEK